MPREPFVQQQIERQFHFFVENVAEYSIFLLDAQGCIQSWNPGAQRLSGYVAEEVLGQPFSLFYAEEDRAVGKPALDLDTAVRAGRFEGEGWQIRKDTSRFWAVRSIAPFYDEQEQLAGFVNVTHELTARKEYEKALLDSQREKQRQTQLLLTVIDSSPAGIVLFEPVVNPEGLAIDFKYKLTNLANAATVRHTVEELLGNSVTALFPDVKSRLFWQQLVACYQTGQVQRHRDHYTGDGLNLWIDGTFLKQGDDVLFVFQDVTELKQTQMELEKRLEVLQEAKQQVDIDLGRLKVAEKEVVRALEREREMHMLKTEFVKLVSHQFRTPMTSILLKAEAMRRFSERSTDPVLAQKVVAYSEQVGRDIHRLNKLITEVLIHERIHLGQVELRSEWIELVEFCQNLIKQQRQHDPDYQRVVFESDKKELLARVDPALLEQILENLISNALKYSVESESPVEVYVGKAADGCVVTIKDYGIGIPADEMKYLTNSFYRASNTTHYSGTGLGLSLAHRLVEMHGGQLEIKSEQNQYTLCTIKLPNQRCA